MLGEGAIGNDNPASDCVELTLGSVDGKMPVEEINFSDYERQILLDPAKYFAGGKRVSNDIYIHIDHPDTRRFLDIVSRIYQWPADANVLRVSRNPDKRTASFSHYVDFLDDPFPALKWSHHFDLGCGLIGSTILQWRRYIMLRGSF